MKYNEPMEKYNDKDCEQDNILSQEQFNILLGNMPNNKRVEDIEKFQYLGGFIGQITGGKANTGTHYFASCLNGDYELYMKVKRATVMDDKKGKLWIIGDAISGTDPEGSIRILDDIRKDPHVELILGNEEYAQVMLFNTEEIGGAPYEEWWEYTGKISPSSRDFTKYIKSELSPAKRKKIRSFLEDCEVSAVASTGSVHIYMVHRYPTFYHGDDSVMEWQFNCVDESMELRNDFFPWSFIKSDPAFSPALVSYPPASEKNTYLVLGQVYPDSDWKIETSFADTTDRFLNNQIFFIGRKDSAEKIPLLGVDVLSFRTMGPYWWETRLVLN